MKNFSEKAISLQRGRLNVSTVMAGEIDHNVVGRFSMVRLLGGVLLLLVMSGTETAIVRADTMHDGQFWFPLYNRFSPSDKVRGWFEINPRFGNDMSEIHQLLIRPALGYQITPGVSLWQGYAWVTNYESRFTDEHRLYQQLSYRRKFEGWNIFSRTRTEQRFIRDARGVSLRAREFLRMNVPLNDRKQWSFVLYDEIFVSLNATRNGPRSGFDQNRLFIGLNRKITPHLSMDFGYQNQSINTSGPRVADVMNHILLIQWFIDWTD